MVDVIDLINNISFLTPTIKLKELLLLQHIEENPDTTQKKMASVINAAPSMVNVYLNKYEENKYIKREYISARIVRYMITTEGIKRKNYLLITYLHELLKLYDLAEDKVESFLTGLETEGYRNLILYGAGEVAETILGIVKGRDNQLLNIVAVIDDDEKRRNEELLGFKIIARADLAKYQHDAVVITSYTFEDEIMKRLQDVEYPMDKVRRFFSK